MLLHLTKTANGLIPADEDSQSAFAKMQIGNDVFVEYKPRRNYANHKRFFSMLKIIFESQSHYKSIDNILEICKFRSGYFETIITHTGKKHYKTKSIDFCTMDEDDFKVFFSSSIDTCLELVPMGKVELENAILRYT